MRDTRIDFLRFTGLMMIILAHVYPPPWLFQLRNFDVPLMVFISGLSYRLSVKDEPYASYVWARVQRLVFPVWIFLTLFFTLQFFYSGPFDDDYITTMLRSYLLLDGIGYVWIIRVFLVVALAAPFIYMVHRKQKSHRMYLLLVAVGYAVYEVLASKISGLAMGGVAKTILQWFFTAIPYVLIFAFAIRVVDLSTKTVVAFTIMFAAVFGGWFVYYIVSKGTWQPTQPFKYPATSYYLSFALMMAGFLYLTGHWWMQMVGRLKLTSLVLFIGSNSIWIYLWHILFLRLPLGIEYFALLYAAVLLGAVTVTFFQVKVVQWLISHMQSKKSQRTLRVLLTG